MEIKTKANWDDIVYVLKDNIIRECYVNNIIIKIHKQQVEIVYYLLDGKSRLKMTKGYDEDRIFLTKGSLLNSLLDDDESIKDYS